MKRTSIALVSLILVLSACATNPTPTPGPGPNPTPAPVVDPLIITVVDVAVTALSAGACAAMPAADQALACTGANTALGLLTQDPAAALAALQKGGVLSANPIMDAIWPSLNEAINLAQAQLNVSLTAGQWMQVAEGVLNAAVTGCKSALGASCSPTVLMLPKRPTDCSANLIS